MQLCLSLEADDRPTCSQLLRHELFTGDGFALTISRQLRTTICREYESNPLTAQTMRHRYERCRRQLQKTATQPTDETDQRQLTNNDTHQPNMVNNHCYASAKPDQQAGHNGFKLSVRSFICYQTSSVDHFVQICTKGCPRDIGVKD